MFLNKLNTNPNLYILWTNKSNFTNCSKFNRGNFYYYANENPHVLSQRRFADNLNGGNYLEFLEYNPENVLNNLQLNIRDVKYFQNDLTISDQYVNI